MLLKVKQSRQNQAYTYKQMRQDNDRMWIKKNISFHTDSRNLAYQTSTPIIHEPSTISTTFLREQFYNCEIWFSIFKGLADIPWTCLTSPNMCDSRMSSIRHRCQVNQNPTPPLPLVHILVLGLSRRPLGLLIQVSASGYFWLGSIFSMLGKGTRGMMRVSLASVR